MTKEVNSKVPNSPVADKQVCDKTVAKPEQTPQEAGLRLMITVTGAYIQSVRSEIVALSEQKGKIKDEEKVDHEKFDLVLRTQELHLAHLLDIFHKGTPQARELFPEEDNTKLIDEIETLFDTFIAQKVIKQCICDYCLKRESKTVVLTK